MKHDSAPNEPLPPCFSIALLGRRVELDLARGYTQTAVVVGLARGVLRLRCPGTRRDDGSWTATGLPWFRTRAEVRRITVIDLDATDATNHTDTTKWTPKGNPWSPR